MKSRLSDAVAAWYVDDGITGKRFQAEDLRELLVKRGLLAGSELYGRLHKHLPTIPVLHGVQTMSP